MCRPQRTASRSGLFICIGAMLLVVGQGRCLAGAKEERGAQDADWPQWRGPRRNGISPEKGLSKDWKKQPPRQLWKANVGIGFSSIAVSKGLAFATGNRDSTDTVYAFDAKTGKVRWKHSYACKLGALRHEGGPFATPTVDGNRVYTLSKAGHLFCFDAGTGRVVWQTDVAKATGTRAPNYGFAGSPLAHGGLLILNVGPAGAAVDKATGKVVWKSAGSARAGHASPLHFTAAGRRAVAILAKRQFVGLEPASGRVLWSHALSGPGLIYKITDPVFLGDRVFITASYGNLCAMFRITDAGPQQVWQTTRLVSKFLNPVVVDGHIVGGHRERDFRCIDPATGEVKWKQRFTGNVVVAGGACLILTVRGELILAEVTGEAYRELGRARVLNGKCWTPPALSAGRVYCRNAQGDVVCVDVSGGQRSGS